MKRNVSMAFCLLGLLLVLTISDLLALPNLFGILLKTQGGLNILTRALDILNKLLPLALVPAVLRARPHGMLPPILTHWVL